MYSSQLLDHFENPRNSGVVLSPHAVTQSENPVCGDVLKLSARVAEGCISEIKFQAKGCVPAIACGSVLTELLWGVPVSEAAHVEKRDIIRALDELPPASGHAADLAITTLKSLLAQLPAIPAR